MAGLGALYLIGPDRMSLAPELALGNLLIVVAMFCYSLYLVHSKAMVMRYGPVTVSAYVMMFSAIGTLPLGLSGLATVNLAAIRPVTWMWVAYIVVFPTIVAYFLNIWALRAGLAQPGRRVHLPAAALHRARRAGGPRRGTRHPARGDCRRSDLLRAGAGDLGRAETESGGTRDCHAWRE